MVQRFEMWKELKEIWEKAADEIKVQKWKLKRRKRRGMLVRKTYFPVQTVFLLIVYTKKEFV
jgi:hypothetical protein